MVSCKFDRKLINADMNYSDLRLNSAGRVKSFCQKIMEMAELSGGRVKSFFLTKNPSANK